VLNAFSFLRLKPESPQIILIRLMKFGMASCLLLPSASFAANSDAMEILRRTAATYQKLESYEFHVTVHTIRGSDVTEQHFTETGMRLGKYRIANDDPSGELRVGDGQIEWSVNLATNEYKKDSLSPETPISEFEAMDQHVANARIAREELFMVDGKPEPVYVVQVVRDRWPQGALKGMQFVMYRIDEKNFIVHKVIAYARDATQINLYYITKWNQPVPDTLFAFKPPQSAHIVSAMRMKPTQPKAIIGTEAPDFTLADAAGHQVSLRELRGKVVIVDFWASWCGPCRAQMPFLQQLYRDLAAKGLVVLGLDVGEDAEEVTRFATQESYTFTLLLGAEPDIAAQYYVEGYPTTFVVDRRGHIVFRSVGGEPPERLQAAVNKALAEKP
jgi:peroxiredoxin/outer membrane lipoprotein-sorting protein